MVKAQARMKDGRILLVLGISQGNVDRLQQGKPIYFDADAVHIGAGEVLGGVTVFYGVDEDALAAVLHQMIGPETEVIVVPRGDAKPQ